MWIKYLTIHKVSLVFLFVLTTTLLNAFDSAFDPIDSYVRKVGFGEAYPKCKKLLMFLKLNYSSQEIADILFVSIHAVNKSRQRLNKKTQENL